MRKVVLLFLLVAAGITGLKAQSFINRIPTVSTGITGTVEYDGLTLRQYSFSDVSPNLPEGTRIELLNKTLLQTDDGLGLWCAKIKVLEGTHKGKIGYVYASLTSWNSCADYTNGRITCKGTGGSSGGSFIDQLPTENTGLSGTVEYDGLTLRQYSFSDVSPNLPEGTRFELLNRDLVQTDDGLGLWCAKIKVSEGAHKGKVGYVYASLTSFNSCADYTSGRITCKGSSSSSSSSSSGGSSFLNQIPTENTGVTGTVEYDGLTLRQYSFSDVSPNLPEGTRIELLSYDMIPTDDGLGLWCAKVKVLEGTHKGKIGFVYASLTSWNKCANYTTGRLSCR